MASFGSGGFKRGAQEEVQRGPALHR
jgi:hypothetical protein